MVDISVETDLGPAASLSVKLGPIHALCCPTLVHRGNHHHDLELSCFVPKGCALLCLVGPLVTTSKPDHGYSQYREGHTGTSRKMETQESDLMGLGSTLP